MLGNLDTNTIEEILNGPGLREIQDTLRQGVMHEKYCSGCISREGKGGDSERSWHNRVNEDFNPVTAPEHFEFPAIIDVRWNTTCNLSCNYCDPSASSKWAAILKKPVISGTRHYYEQVCEYIEKHYDQVKEVALVGGCSPSPPFLRRLPVSTGRCVPGRHGMQRSRVFVKGSAGRPSASTSAPRCGLHRQRYPECQASPPVRRGPAARCRKRQAGKTGP